uniref:Uncharacterized protein n=1 Tax=Oryza glumipatula TaxID=40148 RepID=A0A0E0BNS5_9ORYZ
MVDLGKAWLGRTRVIDDEPVNPRWDERFHLYCAYFADNVIFSVKVSLPIGAALIGRAYLPFANLLSGEVITVDGDGKWWGTGTGVGDADVPCTYFKQHTGCRVTRYQDAHVPD